MICAACGCPLPGEFVIGVFETDTLRKRATIFLCVDCERRIAAGESEPFLQIERRIAAHLGAPMTAGGEA